MEAVAIPTALSAAGAADAAHEAAAPSHATTAAASAAQQHTPHADAGTAPAGPAAAGRAAGVAAGGGGEGGAGEKERQKELSAARPGRAHAATAAADAAAPDRLLCTATASTKESSAPVPERTHAAGAAAGAAATVPAAAQQKKCTRPGCGKKYFEAENTAAAAACCYHAAMPIFHDGVKKWPCCGREAWDWEEFMQIPGCARGTHSDAKDSNISRRSAAAAAAAPSSAPTPAAAVKIRDIEEFNRQQQRLEEKAQRLRDAAAADKAVVPQLEKPFVTAEGKYKCVNKGCHKEYFPEENKDGACSFHPGQPIFRDCMKSWTCCNAKSYDWDEFMQLPPCQRGQHTPKMVAQ